MENKKQTQALRRGKINIIDFLIVVFVLLLISAFVFVGSILIKNADTGETKNEQTEGYLTYTVVIYNLSQEDVDKILTLTEADAINNVADATEVGVLVSIPEIEDYEEIIKLEDGGEYVTVIKKSATFDIKVKCSYIEGIGYLVNDCPIRIGSATKVITTIGEYDAYCINFSYEEQKEDAK